MKILVLLTSCMLLLLSGCGQSGALYLPPHAHATTSSAASSVAPANS